MRWPFTRKAIPAPRSIITLLVNNHPVFLIKVVGLVEMERIDADLTYEGPFLLTVTRVTRAEAGR